MLATTIVNVGHCDGLKHTNGRVPLYSLCKATTLWAGFCFLANAVQDRAVENEWPAAEIASPLPPSITPSLPFPPSSECGVGHVNTLCCDEGCVCVCSMSNMYVQVRPVGLCCDEGCVCVCVL